jgi:hypothetical protein
VANIPRVPPIRLHEYVLQGLKKPTLSMMIPDREKISLRASGENCGVRSFHPTGNVPDIPRDEESRFYYAMLD